MFQEREAGTDENRWLAHQKERERSKTFTKIQIDVCSLF